MSTPSRREALAVLAGVAAFMAGGCGEDAVPPAERGTDEPDPQQPASAPNHAGSIHGRVVWQGEQPLVMRFKTPMLPPGVIGLSDTQPNPHAPRIDPSTQGVANAVVFLRGVSLEQTVPWQHPPVRVHLACDAIGIHQGDSRSPIGFVRSGDRIAIARKDSAFQSLHGTGADFFTLAFADDGDERWRQLRRKGIVELSSAAGYFWLRSYLFVDDQPYYARTDSQGRFQLDGVPPGDHQLVCWMPHWRVLGRQRDTETGRIVRVTFAPPIQRVQPVLVAADESRRVEFALSLKHFAR